MNFSAALLAGGRSSRMGRDKAFLDWQGRPLWRVQIEKLIDLQPSQLFLAAREEQNFANALAEAQLSAAVELLIDPVGEDRGPIAAIARCLRRAAQPLLVLAVDMPQMTTAFLRESLLSQAAADKGVIAHSSEAFESLAAVYSPRSLPFFEEAIERQLFALQPLVRRLIEADATTIIELTQDDEMLFANANTLESFQRLTGA